MHFNLLILEFVVRSVGCWCISLFYLMKLAYFHNSLGLGARIGKSREASLKAYQMLLRSSLRT